MAQISDEERQALCYNLLIMSRNLKNKRNIINNILHKAKDDNDVDLVIKMEIKKQEINIEYMSNIDDAKNIFNDSEYLAVCNKLKRQYDINSDNLKSLNEAKKMVDIFKINDKKYELNIN